MRRTAVFCVFAIAAVVGWLALVAAQTPKVPTEFSYGPTVTTKGADEKVALEKTVADQDPALALRRRADFPGIADNKATLADALKVLSTLYHVEFDFNTRSFMNEGIKVPEDALVAEKPLPAARNIRLDAVLKRVLARVPSTSGATFLVRGDTLEITTNQFAQAEIWGDGYDGPCLPLVQLRADNLPLGEALKQLADQSKFNIVNAGGVEKAAALVTAHLDNVPVDTAVRLLTLQTGLAVVHRDNVLLVTTEEKAAALKAAFLAENRAESNPDQRLEYPEGNPKWRRGGSPQVTSRVPPDGM